MSVLGWCSDGDRALYYGGEPTMALHNICRHGQSTMKGSTLECDCWCHTGATKPPKKAKGKTVKRNGRAKVNAMVVDSDIDPSKAGKKGYSKNGKKLGRPKGAKNRVKVKSV